MPDVAICDPEVTLSMPAHITAETGMDAMTHNLEALVSNRANVLSDALALMSIEMLVKDLPAVYKDLKNLELRESVLNAAMIAGLAFTNVSLGIVHSMAHTIGGHFRVAHGLADAVILPYIIRYNKQDQTAVEKYALAEKRLGVDKIEDVILQMNQELNIADSLQEIIEEEAYLSKIDEMAVEAVADGCTKTSPIIPDLEEFKELFKEVYYGKRG